LASAQRCLSPPNRSQPSRKIRTRIRKTGGPKADDGKKKDEKKGMSGK